MSGVQYEFIQSIKVAGEEVNPLHIINTAYIENIDMSGVQLIIKLNDKSSYYRDDMGICTGAEIEVDFTDFMAGAESSWSDTFVVAKHTADKASLTLECWAKSTHELKALTEVPQFFVDKQPKEILTSLLPDLTVVADSFSSAGTYHLNAGGTKSKLLRDMARDYGAVCFISRGNVYFKDLRSIMTSADEEYILDNSTSENHSLIDCRLIGESGLYERVANRSYYAWDRSQGMVFSTANAGKVKTRITVPNAAALDSHHIIPIPTVEALIHGWGSIAPAHTARVQILKWLDGESQDESFPEQLLISRVTHYQERMKYLCKLELSTINGIS